MNLHLRERVLGYLRAYWQQCVYVGLGLVLAAQLGTTLYRILELRHVDSLIAQAESSEPPPGENENSEDQPNRPQSGMRGPGGQPGGPPDGGTPRRPEKDIFRNEEQKFALTAIYLDKAVINGQEVAVGGRIGKATLESILPFSVTIHIEGEDNPRTVEMFTGQSGGSMGKPMNNRSSRDRSRPSRPGPDMSAPSMPMMVGPGGPGGGMRGAMRNLSPEQRRDMIRNAPPEVRERMMRRMEGQ